MDRDKVLVLASWSSGTLAVVSLCLALLFRTRWCQYKDPWGYILLALWAGGPPVWFLLEYTLWPPAAGPKDERARHLHDLARNIWLAFIVILGVAMDIKWPGLGG